MANGTVFHNQDGIVLEATPLPDPAFTEIDFGFLDLAKRNDQMFISIAAMHMVLTEDLGIDFVLSSFTQQRCVVHSHEFDADARRLIATTVVGIRSRMGLIYRLADEHFFVDGNGGPLVEFPDPTLAPYAVTEGLGLEFVEAFSSEYRSTTPSDAP